MIKKIVALTVVATIMCTPAWAASVKGKHGEILSVSKVSQVRSGDYLVVSGSRFDETIGIYVAMCKVVAASQLPSPCGGGADKSGATGASVWISSNPPTYGIGLAKPYSAGGRFSVRLKVSPLIGKLDCRIIKCAIYVRADHTRSDDRSFDLAVPLNFKK